MRAWVGLGSSETGAQDSFDVEGFAFGSRVYTPNLLNQKLQANGYHNNAHSHNRGSNNPTSKPYGCNVRRSAGSWATAKAMVHSEDVVSLPRAGSIASKSSMAESKDFSRARQNRPRLWTPCWAKMSYRLDLHKGLGAVLM